MAYKSLGSWHAGNVSIAFGTAIAQLIPPKIRAKTRLKRFDYLSGGTAHTVTIAKPVSRTTLTAVAAGAQAVINLAADPGLAAPRASVIAAGDFVCVQLANLDANGNPTFFLGKVSSVATLAITLTANLPTGGALLGAIVWFFGAPGDHTGPTMTAGGQTLGLQYKPTVSVVTTFAENEAGVMVTTQQNDPLLVHSDNITATGTFVVIAADYTIN